MPRAPKACGINGCRTIVPNGKRCPEHCSGWKTSPRTASAGRTNTAQWKQLRAKALQRDGHLCQIRGPRCIGHADQVDHITNVANGGTDQPANLQAVCRTCHATKTAREGQAGRGGWATPPPGSRPCR